MTTEQRLTKAPDESRADFIARIVATAQPPAPEVIEQLRRLLPVAPRPVSARRGAA